MLKSSETQHDIKESNQQATTSSSNQSNTEMIEKTPVSFSGDQWDECELSQIIREKNFEKLKVIYHAEDKSDAEILKHVAFKVCETEYRKQNDITIQVASSVFGEARDQLELMGEDITSITNAYSNIE